MKRLLLVVVAALVILAGVAFAYYKTSRETFQANQQLSDEEVEELVAAVGRHILLPEGEVPLIATIADINLLLEKEPFYRGAKNGDLLLLYPNAGKAILYNKESDIIINVGPIILDQEAQTTTDAGTAPAESLSETQTTPEQ